MEDRSDRKNQPGLEGPVLRAVVNMVVLGSSPRMTNCGGLALSMQGLRLRRQLQNDGHPLKPVDKPAPTTQHHRPIPSTRTTFKRQPHPRGSSSSGLTRGSKRKPPPEDDEPQGLGFPKTSTAPRNYPSRTRDGAISSPILTFPPNCCLPRPSATSSSLLAADRDPARELDPGGQHPTARCALGCFLALRLVFVKEKNKVSGRRRAMP